MSLTLKMRVIRWYLYECMEECTVVCQLPLVRAHSSESASEALILLRWSSNSCRCHLVWSNPFRLPGEESVPLSPRILTRIFTARYHGIHCLWMVHKALGTLPMSPTVITQVVLFKHVQRPFSGLAGFRFGSRTCDGPCLWPKNRKL